VNLCRSVMIDEMASLGRVRITNSPIKRSSPKIYEATNYRKTGFCCDVFSASDKASTLITGRFFVDGGLELICLSPGWKRYVLMSLKNNRLVCILFAAKY